MARTTAISGRCCGKGSSAKSAKVMGNARQPSRVGPADDTPEENHNPVPDLLFRLGDALRPLEVAPGTPSKIFLRKFLDACTPPTVYLAHRAARNSDPGEKGGSFHVGEQIGITTGKRLVRRVFSVDPPRRKFRLKTAAHCTESPSPVSAHTHSLSPQTDLFTGAGQGREMTANGEAAKWTGTGVGKFGPGGSVSYRGMLFFRSTSQKLARLNIACVAFEYDVDSPGSTISKMWESK